MYVIFNKLMIFGGSENRGVNYFTLGWQKVEISRSFFFMVQIQQLIVR